MAVTWLLIVMVGAIFVSMVLLAVVCVRCRNDGPLVSIRQASEESTEFRVIHPAQPTIGRNSVHPSSNLLSPFSPLDPGTQRKHRSFTTETESNPSYENPADGPDYINESDGDESGYIVVLPEGEARPTDQSRPSTPSSDNLHDYENIPTKEDAASTNKSSVSPSPTRLSEDGEDDNQDYLNVEPLHFQKPSSGSDTDTDTEDEGNYVNVNDSTV